MKIYNFPFLLDYLNISLLLLNKINNLYFLVKITIKFMINYFAYKRC